MYIDLHCDTIIKYIKESKPEDLMYGEKSDINLGDLIKNKVKAQFMAIYLYDSTYEDDPGLGNITDWEYIEKCTKFLDETALKYEDKISIVKNYKEYTLAKESNRLSLFKTIEDGRCIEKIEDIQKLKDLGIALVTLLWNNPNKIGYPHSMDLSLNKKGLTEFGIDVVEEMNDKGIIIDVSHMSEGGFWDICKYSKSPFIATHSDSKNIQNHSRNLADDQVKAIAERNGIIGLNVFPPFVNGKNKAEFKDYIKHVKHIVNIGGEDILGIGTDFDGINGDYEISDSNKVIEFINFLNLNGFSSSFLEKFAYKNVESFLENFNW